MQDRERGAASILTLVLVAPVLLALAGQGAPLWAALKDGPTDTRTLNALITCFIAGCVAQLSFLLAHIGDDQPRPFGRWVGEILLGGFSAYIGCVAFLKYGPTVDLPQLIVPAVVGGFAGQRAIVMLIEWGLKKAGITSPLFPVKRPPGGDTDAP